MSASSDAGISGLPNAFSLTNFQTVAAREAAATLSALRMTDPIGPIRAAIAGRYEIEREIGQGAFATVYLARDLRHDRLVAFKVLTANLDSEDSELRFLREIRLLARLQHPNILPLIDSGHAEALLYYVMPYVKGESLRERIHRERQLAIDAAIGIAREAADALACAHEQGIVHRDIKPENILLSAGHSMIADFGVARAIDVAGVRQLTRTGFGGPGTPAYMSPEQMLGDTQIDRRSDIYSLGCVLYEMLTGKPPFHGEGGFVKRFTEPPPLPSTLRRDLPKEVERIVTKALARDPGDRYATAAEFGKALAGPAHFAAAPGGARLVEPRPDYSVLTSVAVLAFTDMSAAKDQGWFCDGIAEEILNALAPLKGLRVAARTSAFSFKGKSDDLRTIGEKLNVTTVLEGSVRRAGDRVRITVQLSDVKNGFQLWSERYDRELRDIFDVQDEIAKAIADRLRVALAGSKDDRLVEKATTNVEAYQLYLEGRALLDRRGASVPAALDLFRKAVELDPDYSLAWAGIADAFTVLAYAGAARGSESKPQAMAAAKRSIELDPTSAAGHTALACATLLYENNRAMAKQEFERALELSPTYVLGRCWYALFYFQWARGEFEHGIAEARRALEIDPLSAYVTMILGACLFTAGRLDEAIETCRRAVHQDPESFVAHWALGISLGLVRRFEEAVSTLEAAAGMSGRHPLALTALAGVLAQWGKPSEASALHRELMDRASRTYVPLAHLGLTAEAAGQHEEALAFVRRAWDEREPPFILHARHFPGYRTLRSDPRFAAILREMDVP